MTQSELSCDLAVIGAGMAGLAAALFAANKGVSTLRVGVASEIIFASGFIDLMGVHPIANGTRWENPWAAIEAVSRDIPAHPYARMKKADIKTAIDTFLSCLTGGGIGYEQHPEGLNSRAISPVGTVKTTFCVPKSMWNGVQALQSKPPVLVLGIRGLRGFSARQIAETLKSAWPGVRSGSFSFPDADRYTEVYTERMARSLALSENREKLAAIIRPMVEDAQMVGLPAIFGIQNSDGIIADMAERIGVPLFEIPTMPPSIPGLRIKEIMDEQLAKKGVIPLLQKRVLSAKRDHDVFVLDVGHTAVEHTVRASAVILATGRFIGKGLTADRMRIRESLFDLPVHQSGARRQWHRQHFLDPRGHSINLAGLDIDDGFHPVDAKGRPVFENLFAAGSILAHQDWMRMKCGAGVAIATAYGAVQAFVKQTT